jgi:general stress protein YciG
MDPERQRAIARKGGASVPAEKRTFSVDRALAASAGSAGGKKSRRKDHLQKDVLRPQADFDSRLIF